jgi:hypothetical protein
MFSTSTVEVFAPRLADFALMLPDQPFDSLKSGCAEPYVVGEGDLRFEPVLGLTFGTVNVNV